MAVAALLIPTTRRSFFLFVMTSFLQFSSSSSAVESQSAFGAGNIVEEACRRTGVHYSLCVAQLGSAPSTMDLRGLATLAVNLTAGDVAAAGIYTEGLVKSFTKATGEDGVLDCLSDCEEEYEDACQQLNQAMGSMEKKAFGEAAMFVGAAMSDVKVCQEGCHGVARHKNVLTVENKKIGAMCSIALTFIGILQH